MSIRQQAVRYGQRKLASRLARSIPWLGAAVVIATIGSRMRSKGVMRGGVDAGLDAIPFVGALKNVLEAVRGRDFIPERDRGVRS